MRLLARVAGYGFDRTRTPLPDPQGSGERWANLERTLGAALGAGVTGFSVGELVLVHEAPLPGGSGTWAEQVLVRAAHAAVCPPPLSPRVAAGLPVAALTAQQALADLMVGPHTRLLIVGASGPTAALALELANRSGATVVATAGPAHAERLRGLGATEVIDSHTKGWARDTDHRFDAALIAVNGTAEDAMTLLEDGGRLCSITSDAPTPARGITSTNLYVRPDAGQLADLAALAADGQLALEVHAVAPAEVPAIADMVASGRSGGAKYVLEF